MKLTVNISADCYRTFLDASSVAGYWDCPTGYGLLPLVVHSTPPAELLEPGNVISTALYASDCDCPRIPRTFSHNRCTSTSANCLHCMRLSIHPSSVGIEAGSDAGDSLAGSGARLTSSILVSMIP